MSNISNGKWKLLSFALMGVLISGIGTMAVLGQVPVFVQQDQVNSPQLLPSAYGAGVLTNVFALPSNNVFKGTGYYNIAFTTATTGTIKTIEITFPAGFNVAGAKLIQTQGTGAGSLSVSGQTVKYTITTPVSVTAPKGMSILVANIVNAGITSNQVSIVTKDASNVVIDGPTNSATFTLTRVTNSMVQSGLVLKGSASIDSPTLAVDSVNDRVGIGTTTPQGTLDVNGDLIARGTFQTIGKTSLAGNLDTTLTYGPLFLINSHSSGLGLVLRSPDAACHEVSVEDSGAVISTPVTCPS